MISPITGKEMILKSEKRKMFFRKEEFEIFFQFWYCEDSHEKFEDERLAELNINQLYSQYKAKHNVSKALKISA